MADVNDYRPVEGKRYLDEAQDDAYARSSLHGDALVEAESRMPVREAAALPGDRPVGRFDREELLLSGAWRMKGCEPADPGSPAPSTGWFGRRGRESPGMAEGWYKPGFDRGGWSEVTVPTTVQKALAELGELADPYWNANTLEELEEHGEPKELPLWFRRTRAERMDWWFAKTFEAPQAWRGRRLTLRFDGLDYSGTVFLNGMSLGHHKGMFGGPELDVTNLVRFDGENELVVRIDQAPQSWNGLLKGSPGYGWHYGHLISQGIWKDVRLRAEPDVSVADVYVVTASIADNEARLLVDYSLRSRLPDFAKAAVRGEIRREGSGAEAAALRFLSEVDIAPGLNKLRAEVALPNPDLWWPIGYGDPSLYRLSLQVGVGDGEPADGESVAFGVRTVEMRPLADTAEETEYRWQFVVNGVPMFVKGANWCWTDPMLEQSEAKYERMLELARRGNVQMLRAWGGGIVEDDCFYRLCDEKGIMVYQEFPFCWGPIDSPHTDLGVVDRQVAESVKRLRSHPSLVMWGGGNENGPHGGADEGLFLVGRRCRQLDPSRPFHRTDPWGGSVHNWHVYHFGEPLDAATLGMPSVFYGEFGIPSMTNRSSCVRYVPEEELASWPPTEESRGWLAHFHQFGLKDVIKVMRYGAYGPIRGWDDYILYSQTAQGDSIRFTADMQRSRAGRSATGFWYYKFTDLFPGHSWAVVDFYGTPKLSYYRALQACRPRSAFATAEKLDGWREGETFAAELHVANDTREPLEGASVSAVLYGSGFGVLGAKRVEGLTLAANETRGLGRIEAALPSADDIRPFLLAVALRAADGTLLSDQWYWFNAQPKPEELAAFERAHVHNDNEYPGEEAVKAFELYAGLPDAPLRRLPGTRLEWRIERSGEGGVIAIRNSGDVPAVRVTVEGFPDDWDCYLEENDFGLYPGEERRIAFEAGSRARLDGLRVGAWNAPATGADGR
ncbi:beta-mannosidase [Cohnella xylanilytica]|uniref:glycoside hydrolase family 2 protein n=1 Tax=Cohnella xylanilytica TaxID=557555 RepID=UPI001B030579|nr:sugar-binding domain-containing protein [Cohnella xylanilytica]GIO14100.1 beta-mannosidase [Cohnella xylanilytica]